MPAKTNSLPKDFDAAQLVSTSKNHEQQLRELSDRISVLEQRVGTDEAFGKTFASSSTSSKILTDAVGVVISDYDKHLIAIKGIALLKWLSVLAIGGIIGALIRSIFPS